MPSKPLLFSPETPDPETVADDFLWEETDPAYIPGYTEVQRANDLSLNPSQVVDGAGNTKQDYYMRWGTGPRDLPVEFAWLPISDGVGRASRIADKDRGEWLRRGFKPCSKQDFDALKNEIPGLDLPFTAHEAPDGTIRKGIDEALYVVRKNAPAYVAYQRRKESDRQRRANVQSLQGQTTRQEFDLIENERGKINVGERD